MKSTCEVQAKENHKLNVLFHGLFSFVFWDHCIEALAPDVSEHVYKAGTWEHERRLREGWTYQLEGVADNGEMPGGIINPTVNAVLRDFGEVDRWRGKVFCSFLLPFPELADSMRRIEADQKRPFFIGTDSAGLATTLSLVQGFSYAYEDKRKLRLATESPWETLPWVPIVKDNGYVNLHIWAEPDDLDLPVEHTLMTFKQLVGLFPGLDLRLAYRKESRWDPSLPTMPGVDAEELKSLAERQPLLGPGFATDVRNCISMSIDNSGVAGVPEPRMRRAAGAGV